MGTGVTLELSQKTMETGVTLKHCGFPTLFTKNVPHILEKIFFYTDFHSYKECLEMSNAWKDLLTSESYKGKAKSVFHTEILRDELKLCKASQKGETEEVRMLLLSGMVDADNIDSSVHSDSYTSVLRVAADGGHLDVVRLLIDSGADPNKASKQYEGFSPLHHAVKSGRIDVVQLLLDAGAEPNATNSGQEISGYRANGEGQTRGGDA